jgi:hypothetical protein
MTHEIVGARQIPAPPGMAALWIRRGRACSARDRYETKSTSTGDGNAPIASPRRSSSVTAWRPSRP